MTSAPTLFFTTDFSFLYLIVVLNSSVFGGVLIFLDKKTIKMEYINFTNIGLILDIFGVLLLFFYGFPSKISRQKPTLVVRNYTDKENKNIIKHFLLSNIAQLARASFARAG